MITVPACLQEVDSQSPKCPNLQENRPLVWPGKAISMWLQHVRKQRISLSCSLSASSMILSSIHSCIPWFMWRQFKGNLIGPSTDEEELSIAKERVGAKFLEETSLFWLEVYTVLQLTMERDSVVQWTINVKRVRSTTVRQQMTALFWIVFNLDDLRCGLDVD